MCEYVGISVTFHFILFRKLSDITRDNKLDVFEFSLAMHFIELKLMGVEIPKQNDITITDCKEVVVPKMTLEEKQQIKDIFEYADTNSQGFLESKSINMTNFIKCHISKLT